MCWSKLDLSFLMVQLSRAHITEAQWITIACSVKLKCVWPVNHLFWSVCPSCIETSVQVHCKCSLLIIKVWFWNAKIFCCCWKYIQIKIQSEQHNKCACHAVSSLKEHIFIYREIFLVCVKTFPFLVSMNMTKMYQKLHLFWQHLIKHSLQSQRPTLHATTAISQYWRTLQCIVIHVCKLFVL